MIIKPNGLSNETGNGPTVVRLPARTDTYDADDQVEDDDDWEYDESGLGKMLHAHFKLESVIHAVESAENVHVNYLVRNFSRHVREYINHHKDIFSRSTI